jgi:hypothetical protein
MKISAVLIASARMVNRAEFSIPKGQTKFLQNETKRLNGCNGGCFLDEAERHNQWLTQAKIALYFLPADSLRLHSKQRLTFLYGRIMNYVIQQKHKDERWETLDVRYSSAEKAVIGMTALVNKGLHKSTFRVINTQEERKLSSKRVRKKHPRRPTTSS